MNATLKTKYRKLLSDYITVDMEDLTVNEFQIIEKSFDLFEGKLDEIKTLNDEVNRLSLELANLKAMTETYDGRRNDNYKMTGECPTCGRDESYRNDF